jgi:uncharacterized protein (UPF0335 family)
MNELDGSVLILNDTSISPGVKIVVLVLVVALLGFFLGRTFPAASSELPKLIELIEKNHKETEEVKRSVQQFTGEAKGNAIPSGTDSKLARLLVTNSAKEKQQLVNDRLTAAEAHTKLASDNVHLVASELQAMNAILTSPESLDAHLLDRVEKERDRLLDMLKRHIPSLVKDIDDQAIKEQESKIALGKWGRAGAVLGYYPASNIPMEAESIQKIVTEHEGVRTRIALLQKQRYNVWACKQIKDAWTDFADPMFTSKKAKLNTCKEYLGPIETTQLEPISMELYRDFLEAIRKNVSSEDYQSLATSLVNAKRIMPGDKEAGK